MANALVRDELAAYEENPRHRHAQLMALPPKGRDALQLIQAAQVAWANQLGAAIGEVFNSYYHGHGFAMGICLALIEHAFTTLGAEQITSGTAAANHPSRKLLERLEFRITSQERGSFQQDADGRPLSSTETPLHWPAMRGKRRQMAVIPHRARLSNERINQNPGFF